MADQVPRRRLGEALFDRPIPPGDACRRLLEVKALLREGKDPVTTRRVNRAARSADTENTIQAIADDWLAMKQKEWSAVHH